MTRSTGSRLESSRPVVGLVLFGLGLLLTFGFPRVGTIAAAQPMPFSGYLILMGGLSCASLAWSRSRLAAIHLIIVALLFGLTDLADSSYSLSEMAGTLVACWILLFTGALLIAPLGSRSSQQTKHRSVSTPEPNVWHFGLGFIVSALNLVLARSGAIGLKSQLETGVSASGLQSLLVASAPLYAVLVFLAAVASRRRVAPAVALLLLQAVASANSGFRGAVISFVEVAVAGLIVTLPADHPWRSRRSLLLLLVASFMTGVLFFWLGSVVRNQVAAASGFSSAGTQVVTPSQFVPYALKRASLGPPLEAAVSVAGAPPAGVTWGDQIVAFLPRFMFPSKPVVTYGPDVAHYYFHEAGNSASSLTWLGDIWVNGGKGLVVLTAICAAVGIALLERRTTRAGPSFALPLVIVLASGVTTPEGALPLSVIGLVRSFFVLALLWGAPLVLKSRKDHASQRPPTDGPGVAHAQSSVPAPRSDSAVASTTSDVSEPRSRLSQIHSLNGAP